VAIAALDFGKRWIGIAAADSEETVVYPVETIERRSLKHDLEVICARLAELGVNNLIVGLPLNMDGTIGPQARAAQTFAECLREMTGLPVELYDERLSSFEAKERLKDANRKKNKKRKKRIIDAIAASVILESWLQRRNSRGTDI
jgi:putative Holliday junction resolvase